MMASRVLSRFLPGAELTFEGDGAGDSRTQRLLEGGGESEHEDHFQDFVDEQELDNMLVEGPKPGAQNKSNKGASSKDNVPYRDVPRSGPSKAQPKSSPEDNDVPASLLMEDGRGNKESPDPTQNAALQEQKDNMRLAWKKAREHQRIFAEQPPAPLPALTRQPDHIPRPQVDRREQALWRWANVENIDGFLLEVYQYYTNHGIYSVLLARLIHILTTAFLFATYLFLSSCVDYSKVPHSKSTSEILIPKCMSKVPFWKNAMLWVFVFWWMWSIFTYLVDLPRLWQLHDFYHYLLGIADTDIQTVAWERVVEGLMNLRDSNPETAANVPHYIRKVSKTTQSKQRMDAHDIANRLMRRDNYYIAIVNKEILDIQLQLPFLGRRSFYSKSLEWCLSFCFENFIFDDHGHVQPHILDAKQRLRMIETLRRRFRFAAIISIVMAPLNIGAQCIYFFSRYYAEFRNAPAQLGARAFTPYAEWKMREFNELEHDFRRRMKMAYPFADRYLAQFPRDKTIQALQFVSLVTGTVAAVLGVATLLDPELFLGFEITPNRTAFFYLSVSMGIFAAARNAVPDDSEVHEPVLHLFEVIEYTHYAPHRWRNRFHTPVVRDEFAGLYQVKVLIFLAEILSLVAAPFILWRNAGRPSAAVIDFFRQNTVHVDGLGGLCNHAVFEFRKRTKPEDDDADHDDVGGLREEYFGAAHTAAAAGGGAPFLAKDNKMAQSQYYFMQRLGKYDRSQAERYRRGLGAYGGGGSIQLPPSFPPLSPLREAAGATRRTTGGTAPSTKAAAAGRSTSPQQSLLLDLRGQTASAIAQQQGRWPRTRPGPSEQNSGAPAVHRKGPFSPILSSGRGRSGPHVTAPAGGLDELDEEVERQAFRDMTTSKLIEADNSLADSWKFDGREEEDDDDEEDDGAGGGGGEDNRRANGGAARKAKSSKADDGGDKGVLGLLVEYSRAHGNQRGGAGRVGP